MNDDTISRQAAIDALKEHRALYCDNTPDTFSILSYAEKSRVDELDTAIATLVNLPSAERRGRWIENEFGAYCSECGLYAYRSNGIPWKSNYCPICGASMMDDNATQHTGCVENALDALDEVEDESGQSD